LPIGDWFRTVLGKVRTPQGEARSMRELTPSYRVTLSQSESLANYNFSYAGSDWMGPLPPMRALAPPAVAGREWDFIPGYNLATEPRAYEPISFHTLRGIAESYDPLRLVIERRKDQMCRLPWTIRLKHDEFSTGKRPTPDKLPAETKKRIQDIRHFFQKPDLELTFRSWFRSLLDDYFVIDAATLWVERNRGDDIMSLRVMDGARFKRIIDDWGRTPRPVIWEDQPFYWNGEQVTPENYENLGFKLVTGERIASQLPVGMPVPDTVLLPPAYQQVLKGLPAVNYTTHDIYYRPNNLRPGKIYGYSSVEQVVMTVQIALRRAFHQLEYYREGNMPEGIFGLPETWSPDQVQKFQAYWDNVFTGQLGKRRQVKFVAGGAKSSYVPFKEPPLKNEFDEYLARIVCFAFSYPPTALVSLNNRSIAEQHDKTAEEEGLQPCKQWACELFTDILEREFASPDLEFAYVEEDEVDQVKQAEILTSYQTKGNFTINQVREKLGEEPDDNPAANMLMVLTKDGLVPIDAMTIDKQVEATAAIAAVTPQPTEGGSNQSSKSGQKKPAKAPSKSKDK
jgi:hypothetical protein